MNTLRTLSMILSTGPLLALAATSSADDIVRIEEDWTVLVQNSAPEIQAPQITNVISPSASTAGQFGVFELNHGTQAEFITGGAQVQIWDNDVPLDFHNSIEGRLLSKHFDRLQYTLAMEIVGGQLRYEIINGQSRSWGDFTSGDDISASVATPLTNLSGYSRDHSLAASTVNVAAHRVYMIYQSRVRYYSAAGLHHTDTAYKTVHRYQDQVTDVPLAEYEENPEYYNVEPTPN